MENNDFTARIVRNPLGIIALFISLIYGMSATLLGVSVGQLTPANQTVLVLFVVAFPFVVLGVFTLLVTRHHTKLYGPGDYRADKSFLDAIDSQAPSDVQKKLKSEATLENSDRAPSIQNDQRVDQPADVKQSSTSAGTSTASIFLLETIVFQKLQMEFKASVRRNVVISNRFELDGIIETPDNLLIAVELMFVAGLAKGHLSINDRIQRRLSYLKTFLFENRHDSKLRKGVVALIIDDRMFDTSAIDAQLRSLPAELGELTEVRTYYASKLLAEYGFSEEENSDKSRKAV